MVFPDRDTSNPLGEQIVFSRPGVSNLHDLFRTLDGNGGSYYNPITLYLAAISELDGLNEVSGHSTTANGDKEIIDETHNLP